MASFKNRRRMAWLSFLAIITILIVSMIGYKIENESLVNTVLYCLTSIVISYYTGVTVEATKRKDS